MPDKPTITIRDELRSLQYEVGQYPDAVRGPMAEALRWVLQYCNADVADQPQDPMWRTPIRQQLCRYALINLASDTFSIPMDQMLRGSVRQNLVNLGGKEFGDN